MVAAGATILDIGGESTRPGAQAVPLQQELDRVIPVIETLARQLSVPVSIDTRPGPLEWLERNPWVWGAVGLVAGAVWYL